MCFVQLMHITSYYYSLPELWRKPIYSILCIRTTLVLLSSNIYETHCETESLVVHTWCKWCWIVFRYDEHPLIVPQIFMFGDNAHFSLVDLNANHWAGLLLPSKLAWNFTFPHISVGNALWWGLIIKFLPCFGTCYRTQKFVRAI